MPAPEKTARRVPRGPAEHHGDRDRDNEDVNASWAAVYGGILDRLPAYVENARWTLCGLSACIDAVVALQSAGPLLGATEPPEAVTLARELKRRAVAGIGGEIRVAWDAGPCWLDERVESRTASGGTAPHAARVLTQLGAPALLALENRSSEQLALIDPAIRLAHGGRAAAARDVAPAGSRRPKVYVFEFTAGQRLDDAVLPRSSRTIVRFHDLDLENDREFAAVSSMLAAAGGSGVLAGLNGLGAGLDAALPYALDLGRRWPDAGITIVHHELSGYERPHIRDRVLDALAGTCTSFGMSLSEYAALETGETDVATGARRLASRLQADRVCIHADDWALTATLRDPQQERDALLAGCLIAATRASLGRPAIPRRVPEAAEFRAPPPAPARDADGWSMVRVAAPYLAYPATTLGLGDTFMAGCLLVLGQPYPPAATA